MTDQLGRNEASASTAHTHRAVAEQLPLADGRDLERAMRGRIAGPSQAQIHSAGGWPVWDHEAWHFLDDAAPATVNPSLWRQARLNAIAGLFEVAEGFYQVRGLDLSNVTFIAGDTGWIVIDPLTSAETARAALDLVTEHLGHRPVHAVIYTHSHIDHFAGVRGIVDEASAASGDVAILAPEGFLEAAISENVIAGTAMSRRASYMYGALLPKGPKGHVDAGLGKGVPMLGTTGLIAPTDSITSTGDERTIDGVRIVFQLTPGTEAPAEMNFHFPDRRILCMAENCSANLHNLYTLRGAQVRDALAWSKELQRSIELFGDQTDVLFASHHWPRWGADDALEHLRIQRDLYRFLHDQTLRLANKGLTMDEIAEVLRLPDSLATDFSARDYYGTVSHNAKAVYQRYLGWFDGNPAHLHPHPPTEAGRRYVEFMGGADAVVAKAQASYDDGDYRWVAEVVNHVVFADPGHQGARRLQADALEQLGYQAESGPWRGFYLTGAQELRNGSPSGGGSGVASSGDIVRAMTVELLLDYLGVRLDGLAADDAGDVALTLEVTDLDEVWCLGIEHGALHATPGTRAEGAPTVRCTHAALAVLVLGTGSIDDELDRGTMSVDGDDDVVRRLAALLDDFHLFFSIIEP